MEYIDWIRDVIYVIPIAVLIWRASTLASRVKQNEKDIADVKTVIERQNDDILNTLKDLTKIINSLRTDVEILKTYKRMEYEGNRDEKE